MVSSDDCSDLGSDDDISRDTVKMDADNILRNIIPNNAANNTDDNDEILSMNFPNNQDILGLDLDFNH